MIIGIGTDLANIDRIQAVLERHGDRFRNRVFTDIEQSKAKRRLDEAGTLAKRWAAKEAVIKAISNASTQSAPLFTDASAPLLGIEISRGPSNAPVVALSGKAKAAFDALRLGSIKVSISHSGEFAVAQAYAGR